MVAHIFTLLLAHFASKSVHYSRRSETLNLEVDSCFCEFLYSESVVSFLFQIKGDDGAVGYYRLLFRLIAQKPLEFFLENKEQILNPNETGLEKNKPKKEMKPTKMENPPDWNCKGMRKLNLLGCVF